MTLTLLLVFSLFLHGALGDLICEELPTDICSFSIASSGKRCILETTNALSENRYQCKTSEVIVDQMHELIETDECVNACGVHRNLVGLSTDFLVEPQFIPKLCSPSCYDNCPNIIDLYLNLALGEGTYLPDICVVQQSSHRRAMTEVPSASPISDAAPRAIPSLAFGPASVDAFGPISGEAHGLVASAPCHV